MCQTLHAPGVGGGGEERGTDRRFVVNNMSEPHSDWIEQWGRDVAHTNNSQNAGVCFLYASPERAFLYFSYLRHDGLYWFIDISYFSERESYNAGCEEHSRDNRAESSALCSQEKSIQPSVMWDPVDTKEYIW